MPIAFMINLNILFSIQLPPYIVNKAFYTENELSLLLCILILESFKLRIIYSLYNVVYSKYIALLYSYNLCTHLRIALHTIFLPIG